MYTFHSCIRRMTLRIFVFTFSCHCFVWFRDLLNDIHIYIYIRKMTWMMKFWLNATTRREPCHINSIRRSVGFGWHTNFPFEQIIIFGGSLILCRKWMRSALSFCNFWRHKVLRDCSRTWIQLWNWRCERMNQLNRIICSIWLSHRFRAPLTFTLNNMYMQI